MMNEETSIYDTNEIVTTYSKEPQKQEKKYQKNPKYLGGKEFLIG